MFDCSKKLQILVVSSTLAGSTHRSKTIHFEDKTTLDIQSATQMTGICQGWLSEVPK
jgi:hypothetical protein